MNAPRHLFVDISSHGFGHIAQTAPVLQRLAATIDGLRLTIRSGLPEWKLRQRIGLPFDHIAAASDFGYVMQDATRIDRTASAARYRDTHRNFAQAVAAEAQFLAQLRPDVVLANVSYLPLAGAARAGIPALAMCSLNWADLFRHFYGDEPWAAPIHAEMLAAYRSATFLRLTPGMPMPDLDDAIDIAPVAGSGRDRHAELLEKVGARDTPTGPATRLVVVALGGIPMRLPAERWPHLTNTHCLVPREWRVTGADFSAIEDLGWDFTDILRSVDVVITKPGYGTFAEAACNGTAVIYQRRDDWPEQDSLIDWLHANARCAEVPAAVLQNGDLASVLDEVLRAPRPPRPLPEGIDQAAGHIAGLWR